MVTIGAAAGGASAALVDVGVNNRFMKQLGENIAPGGAVSQARRTNCALLR